MRDPSQIEQIDLLELLSGPEPLACLKERVFEWLECRIWQCGNSSLQELDVSVCTRLAELGIPLTELLAEMSDESLALCVRDGNLLHLVFEQLFVKRYLEYLKRWLVRWGAEFDVAEDLSQQMLVQFYENRLRNFDPERNFRVYLRQAAYNLWVQHWRSQQHRQHSLSAMDDTPAREEQPEQIAQNRELAEQIQAALLRLPEDQRRVLEQTMEGKTADQIAEALNLPKRAVFNRLFRARRRVEAYLQRYLLATVPVRCPD